MLESFDKILIDFLSLPPALLLETGSLRVRVVEFRISRGDFLAVNDEFVDIDGARVHLIELGEWDQLGVHMSDVTGVEGVLLDQFLKDLLSDLVIFEFLSNFEVEVRFGTSSSLVGADLKPVFASRFTNKFAIWTTFPRAREVDGSYHFTLFIFMFDLQSAKELFRQ